MNSDSLVRPNVVILGRVSRGERQQSPEGQLIALRAAARRLGWHVAAEVSRTMSAWDDESAAAVRDAALAPIISGEADTLAVWAWDRYSRGGIEAAFRELRLLEHHLGAQFFSLQEPFLCTAGSDPAQRELLLSIIAWSARWESQRKSDRLKMKVAVKRSRCESLGLEGRWGRGRLASNTQIRDAYELRAQGASLRGIADALGLSKSQVARIITNMPREAEHECTEHEQLGDQQGEEDADGVQQNGASSNLP